jgi:hypothetical protein
MEPVPYEILEAMVQCFGKAFHYKDGVATFFLTQGVSRPLVDKYRNEPKFVWARRLLTELSQTEDGRLLQRKVLTALCQLRKVPDSQVPDRDAAADALRHLKILATQHDLVVKEEARVVVDKAAQAREHQQLVQDRAAKLEKLKQTFFAAVASADRQAAGYTLQDLLQELFSLFEIEYRKSFRNTNNTQEIDGHFCFQSFDYLVEAKWRKDQPTEAEIGAFKHKVDGKLQGTRGLFVSATGFRKEVVEKFDERGSSIILMDGADLTHLLEGRVDLRDGLRAKIEAAAQRGVVLTSILG